MDDELLIKLKLRLPDVTGTAQDELLRVLLEEAGALIMAMTWRERVPDALTGAQTRLAAIAFNRLGMEGESAHAQGGVSRTLAALPDDLRREIAAFRLAHTGGEG